ncbi:patatin-like phospholipase family protein [Dyadobacter bucti]|uniref:patatin-like phospholipase family protein n=1 Tax=Dyadobacter bucti TaxID=2572203 RepID=UPI003F702B68
MENQLEDDTIHLGICMAGAVSAGAYTAGVIDYLLETLEEWERAKERNENVPRHKVKISAISGSSAGGIISVMMPKIFCTGERPHVTLNKHQTEKEKARNLLYNTWVNFFLDADKDILDEILDPDDIRKKGGLHSLLNSGFKKRVAKEVLENTEIDGQEMPPFVENDLDVIVGLTNTSGYTFNVPFDNGKGHQKENAYTVITHRDLAHFVVTRDYKPDSEFHRGKFPYDPFKRKPEEVQTVADAARGTSAFPVGFIAEHMNRPGQILKKNDLLFKNKVSEPGKILPEELSKRTTERDFGFETFNLDSGTVNNEPFEHLKTVMEKRYYPQMGKNFEASNKDNDFFRSSILLIDPLPDTVSSNDFKKTGLVDLIPQILSLLQNQARFKPDLIAEAVGKQDFSKFIIAPRRVDKDGKKVNGYKAIASGVLGAFGGFLNKNYLKHDFYLGRANCQSFLQHHFVIETETKNPILSKAYQDRDVAARFIYEKGKKKYYYPIIPDMKYVKHFGSFEGISQEKKDRLNVEKIMEYSALPKINEEVLKKWRRMIRRRIRVLVLVIVKVKLGAWLRKKKPKENMTEEEKKEAERKKNIKPLLNIFEQAVFAIYLFTIKVYGISKTLTDTIREELKDYDLYKKH